jgi:hypothetical protein
MLGLPRSTEVNCRMPKEKLYANATLTTSAKDMIKNQIESVVWRNKLADSTMGVARGETIEEIQVFEIALRQKKLDKHILPAIAKAIPYKILFLLTVGSNAQAWLEACGTFYNTDWFKLEGFTLKFEGLNLDTMYEKLVRQIAGNRLEKEYGIAKAVERDNQRQRLKREIAALENKVWHEKQFKRQVEMNGELKRLRAELEGITCAN